MALQFLDGCDHYATADITKKWTTTAFVADATAGRRGTGALKFNADNAGHSKVLPTAAGTVICGFGFYTGAASGDIMQFEGGGSGHVQLKMTSLSKLSVTLPGPSTVYTGTSVLSVGQWYFLELKATIDDTSGSFEVRINGATELLVTGVDTKNGTTGVIDKVYFGTIGFFATSNLFRIDDIYILDSSGGAPHNNFLGDIRIDTVLPNGDGTYTQFTPSTGTDHYALVDDSVPNTTDYNSSSTLGQRDSYNMGNVTLTGAILAVQTNLAVLKDDVGYRNAKALIKSGSTIAYGTSRGLNTTQTINMDIFSTDPNTGLAWTNSAVNALEVGMEIT